MKKVFFVFAFMVALCLSPSAALAVEIGLPSDLNVYYARLEHPFRSHSASVPL